MTLELHDSSVAALEHEFADLDATAVQDAVRQTRSAIARGQVRSSPVGFLRALLTTARLARTKAAAPQEPPHTGAFRPNGSWDRRSGPSRLDAAIAEMVSLRRDALSPADLIAAARERGIEGMFDPLTREQWAACTRWDLWPCMPAATSAAAAVKYAGFPLSHWHSGHAVPGPSTECPECIEADRRLAADPSPIRIAAATDHAGRATIEIGIAPSAPPLIQIPHA